MFSMLVEWHISRLPGFQWNLTENAADHVIHTEVVEAGLGEVSRLHGTSSWPAASKRVQPILFNPASNQNTSELHARHDNNYSLTIITF